MVNRIAVLVVAVVALGAALAAGVGHANITDIYGSAHDTGSPGSPTCQQCHIPHQAQATYLWAKPPNPSMSGLQALCFSCHDGTITNVGQFIADSTYETHDVNPGVKGQDCDRCHEPHQGDNWKFAADTIPASYRNANLCSLCHNTGFTHPQNELTNAPVDRVWDPYTTPPDFSGTQLWDEAGTSVVPTGEGFIKCATCHMPHGGVGGSQLNSMATSDASGHEPICENCHQ